MEHEDKDDKDVVQGSTDPADKAQQIQDAEGELTNYKMPLPKLLPLNSLVDDEHEQQLSAAEAMINTANKKEASDQR